MQAILLYKAEKLSACLHVLAQITQWWLHQLKWEFLEMKGVSEDHRVYFLSSTELTIHPHECAKDTGCKLKSH